jgi:hypothetical protein
MPLLWIRIHIGLPLWIRLLIETSVADPDQLVRDPDPDLLVWDPDPDFLVWDPDPHQNVMAPQHWLKPMRIHNKFLYGSNCIIYFLTVFPVCGVHDHSDAVILMLKNVSVADPDPGFGVYKTLIKQLPQSPFTSNFFWWRHFDMVSIG